MTKDPRPFAEELERLMARLFTMTELAEQRLKTVLRALVDRHGNTLAEVIAGDSEIDELQIEIDNSCFTRLPCISGRGRPQNHRASQIM